MAKRRAAQPHVTTIILTFNSHETIEACIQSVFASTGNFEHEVIVVDNASLDDTVVLLKKLKNQYPFKFVQSKKNDGFAAGINIGLKKLKSSVLQRDDAFAFLLNPDTVIKPRTINRLCTFMRQHPRAGIVEPQMRYPDGSMQSSNFGRFPSVLRQLFHMFKINWLLPFGLFVSPRGLGKRYFKKARQWDWVGGGAMFVRAGVFDSVGLFDERYFLYVEDVDFCKSVRAAGFEIWYEPAIKIAHVLSASFNAATSNSTKRNNKNTGKTSKEYREESLKYYNKKWGRKWF